MRSKSLILLRVVSAFSLAVWIGSSAFAQVPGYPQPSESPKPAATDKPQPSEEEAKAANAINAEPDAAAKLAAADKFVKKYPKSTVRLDVARYVASQIAQVADAAQKLLLAENFQKVFTADNEREVIQPVVFDAYFAAQRTDDAFNLAASVLAKQPDNVGVLTQLTIAGTEEAKRRNPKYIPQSMQYGLKAIDIIEVNKKPARLDEQTWDSLKAMLPHLYQSVGILSMASGKLAEAKPRFEKAAALNPAEPFNYVMLGSIADDEYQKVAESYKTMPEGKPKEEALKKATDLMDKVIDLYARAVGTSEGRPEYKQLHDQILQDVTPYYKYRHRGSTEGLQQLIDKYKVPAKP
jgi:tetratricopeptide (TPR) repeat protein